MNYRTYIKDFIDTKKETTYGYSYSIFAKKADVSKNSVSMIINGKRNLSSKMVPAFIKTMSLKKQEAQYFRNLIDYNHIQMLEEQGKKFDLNLKISCLEKITKLKSTQKEVFRFEYEKFKLISEWYIVALLELIPTKYFINRPPEIKKRFKNKVNEEQIKEAIKILTHLGLIQKTSLGLKRVDKPISVDDQEENIFHLSKIKFLKGVMEQGMNSLDELEEGEIREIGGVTFSANEKQAKKIKEMILNLRKEINKLTSDFKYTDNVYQVNLSLFPLTKK